MRRPWVGGVLLAALASFGSVLIVDFTRRGGTLRYDSIPPPLDRAVDFSADVAPILRSHCVPCHGPETQRGGLRLDSYRGLLQGGVSGPAIVPGSDGGLLIHHVLGLDEAPIMPPPKRAPLDREQIGILRTWVHLGATP